MPELALPWGSQSTSNTFLSIRLRAAQRLTQVVVLPTPPFWFAIAISLAHLCSNYFVKFKFWNIIKHLSSELPTLYIVSWVVIGWIGAWLKYNHKFITKDFENVFLVFVGVVLVSEIYIYFKNKCTKRASKAE